jgi:hypothetical protein
MRVSEDSDAVGVNAEAPRPSFVPFKSMRHFFVGLDYFSARYVGTDDYWKIGANITSLAFSICRYNGDMIYEWYCVGDADEQQ